MFLKNINRFLRIACSVMLLLSTWITARSAFAQNAQGSIVGHVSDSSGAAVTGAKVTVTDTDTSVSVGLTTNSTGDYTAAALNPGNYSITVDAPGFESSTSSNLLLEVQQTLRQNFKLTVGATATTVQVSSDTQMLHTDDTTIGQVVQADMIQALPLNGGDFTNLMLTNVGTNIVVGGSGADWSYHGINTAYTEVSSNGAQAQATSYSIDGVTDTDFMFSVPINVPNELAIQEFKMMSGTYSAQYGVGVTDVNVDIKSGSSNLHGSAYGHIEGEWLQPDSPYQAAENQATGNTTTPVNTPFHQNQFGGTLGGPLFIPHLYNGRKRTFWFLSYDEALYSKVNQVSTDFVPTSAELGGDFSAYPFPIYDPATTQTNPAYNSNLPVGPNNSPIIRTQFSGNKISPSRIDPVAAKIATYFDALNITTCSEAQHLLSGCYNYANNTATNKRQGIGTARIDQYFGANDHTYFTLNLGNLAQTTTSIRFGQSGSVYTRPKLFGATWTHTIRPNILNQATLGYSRDKFENGQNTAFGPDLSANAGLANTNPNPVTYDVPQIGLFDYQGFGGGSPLTYGDNIYQGVDNLTWVIKRHTLNFGIDFRRDQMVEFDNFGGTGSLNFNGEFTALVPSFAGQSTSANGAYTSTVPFAGNALADMLLGQTSGASAPPPIASDDFMLWGSNWNLYFQDDYRLSNNLTLNLGLRWERPANFKTRDGDGYTLNPANGGQFVWANCNFTQPILAAGGNPNFLQCGAPSTLVNIDTKDFAPRIGFSYNPSIAPKLVIRGGFGIFYGLYSRYYDGSQYDKDSLYNETAPSIPSPNGQETQSTAVVQNLWPAPINADSLFSSPGWSFPFNQVNWRANHTPYDEQWTFDTQYSISSTLMLDLGYSGAHGLHQPSQDIIGSATPPTVAGDPCNSLVDISQATGTNASCLNDPNFQPMDTREPFSNMPPYLYANINGFQSAYNAMQAQLIQRLSHGLSYHLNYTWSKTMDVTTGINLINGEPAQIQDPQHPYQMYGLAGSDQTNHLTATYTYEVPNTLFHVHDLNWLLTGWTTSGVYQLASGFPFSIGGNANTDQMSEYYGGKILANSTYQNSSSFHKSLSEAFDTSKYSSPEPGRYGNTNKSPERTPYFTNLDASFGKTTNIWREQSLTVRADIFNLGSTWHSNSGMLFPNSNMGSGNFGRLDDPTFGALSLWNPRTIQLTAQFTF